MSQVRRAASLAAFMIFAVLSFAADARAQIDSDTRRGAGVRAGTWNVAEPLAELTTYSADPHIEGYFQRGLDDRLAFESTVGVWRRISNTIQPTTGNVVQTRTYVIPLFTSLKMFPFTTNEDPLEPFFFAGAGFALGIDDVSENAIGGGGTAIATGFGFKAGAGLELHINDVFGLLASARYQHIGYGGELGGVETYKGFGFEGGVSYRFRL